MPLLKLIGAYTGLTAITLLAGAPVGNGEEYVIGAVNYGKSNDAAPRPFNEWDPEGFDKNVIEQFTRFLNATRGDRSCIPISCLF